MEKELINVERNAGGIALGVCVGFTVGFLMGAAVVALLDHHVDKLDQEKRLSRDTDENYYYSTD